MDVRPIRTEEDLRWALGEIERLWEAEPGTEEGDRLDVLTTLVSAYEDEHCAIPEADPVDVIRGYMEDRDLSQKDLAELLGSRSRASELLSRKRPLTLSMIHKLSHEWSIPAELLTRPYHAEIGGAEELVEVVVKQPKQRPYRSASTGGYWVENERSGAVIHEIKKTTGGRSKKIWVSRSPISGGKR
ncbi:Antitoxin component HigA of the HigAB toxin-antitoxin module, contains an N-terminal HTH domain [Faunimonas pinastri]|uniref:Antitoxin component HigA of the HigAB toxin-antitoxin module, contains an N-terminal HTH domain n=1 Tax=Faunimonas pinastri TaxID=1855383 RepID=A0A1H9QCG3_9HYPH|nr:Antitoxin component HigA of the HigAB toxin-antitoxin module, contains an N-terminal HTH domain [Faunimonas pinastri]